MLKDIVQTKEKNGTRRKLRTSKMENNRNGKYQNKYCRLFFSDF